MVVVDDNFIKLWEGVYRRWVHDVQYFGEIWPGEKYYKDDTR